MNRIAILLVISLAAVLGLLFWRTEPSKLIEKLKPKAKEPPRTGGIKTVGIPQIDASLAVKHYYLFQSPSIPDSRKREIIDKLEKEEKAGYRTPEQTEEYSQWLVGVEEHRATEETWFEKVGGVF